MSECPVYSQENKTHIVCVGSCQNTQKYKNSYIPYIQKQLYRCSYMILFTLAIVLNLYI